ncbi:MAG: hypothetical protein DI616_13530 [Paracoccus denitrificans]|uniref:DUF2059 domain-containing protein n=1 Tax=Paracoccus denitrificans TaxID=266 RepID=A0A533I3I0_PARDE|nr:MAG: hypothetical protein DI616_13530 [Paracoccus denitrificans]
MRHIRIAATVVGVAWAVSSAASLWAQEGPIVAAPPGSTLHLVAPVAETLFQRGLGESRAAVIGVESHLFADRMAAIYMGGVEGESWRNEVARIHDPARVSALLLAAIGQQVQGRQIDTRLTSMLGATGANSGPDGQGMILAARIQLGQPARLEALAQRMQADDARAAPVLVAIDEMIDEYDPVSAEMARNMNRQLAFVRGFAEADGFDFPTSPDDAAADLSLQSSELHAEATVKIRLNWYAAYAPLGPAAVSRSAAVRASPGMRALHALLERAEDDVLAQLAAETGRAAARRMKGTPL